MARGASVHAERIGGGWRLTCSRPGFLGFGRERVVGPDEWDGPPEEVDDALRLLSELARDGGAVISGEGLELSDDVLANLEVSVAELAGLGLPPPCPFRLSISSDRPVADPAGVLRMAWLDADHRPVPGVAKDGTRLTTGSRSFLLRDPLRSLVEAVEATNDARDVDERMRRFAVVRGLLSGFGDEIRAPDGMRGMIVHQATALGIGTDAGPDGPTFVPELLGDVPSVVEGEAPRRSPLLNGVERLRFRRDLDRLHASDLEEARPSYVLGANAYVVLDPGVRAALKVVREVNRSDRGTRDAFLADRMSFLLPSLEEVGSDGSVIEFAERVIGIRRWEGGGRLGGGDGDHAWFPDQDATTYLVRDGKGGEIHVPCDDGGRVAAALREAIAAGATETVVEGVTYPVDAGMLDDLERVPGFEDPTPREPQGAKTEAGPRTYHFVKPKGNVEELTYVEGMGPGSADGFAAELGLLNEPKPHQAEGIAWMQRAYLTGMRGILMADDMGLGKTFQVLAFLRWVRLRAGTGGERKPIMVVAPKSLLGNWLDEVALHVGAGGLGEPLELHGPGVRALRRRATAKGRDIDLAVETLDVGRLQAADWILTTYETLRDYQISLGRVSFEIVVFDEAQKIKESGAMVTEAARSQNAAALRVLMTGTPVENGLMDLWTLMDVAWPGRLGFSGTRFRREFVKGRERDPAELRRLLAEPSSQDGIPVPPLMLRRMKDTVGGLPPKSFRTETETMPPQQTEAYSAVVEAQAAGRMPALAALQAIRNVSLHPDLQRRIDFRDRGSVASFVDMSARMRVLFRILDEVRERDEKALVFIDLRRAQSVLGEIVRHRYRLDHPPHVINGETAGDRRDAIRRGFQMRPGFEVLMLAPRAAGFGLTLHAANHVIHLNRWWNPAVEDQCTDRAHRIGQRREVTVWLPTAEHPTLRGNSYDLILDRLLAEKRRVSGDVIVPVQFDASELSRFQTRVFGDSPLHDELANMDWRSFEAWTAQELIDSGLVANMTPASGDGGADMIARMTASPGRGAIVQVKHRSAGKIGIVSEPEVTDVLRARGRYDLRNPALFLVTNGSVDNLGHAAAKSHAVTVVDHTRIGKVGSIVRAAFDG